MQKMIALMAWINTSVKPKIKSAFFYIIWLLAIATMIGGLILLSLGFTQIKVMAATALAVLVLLAYEVYYIEKAAQDILNSRH